MICIANGETTNITNKEQLLGIQKNTEIKFVVKFEAIQHIISSSCSAPSDGTSPHEFTYNHFGQLTQVSDDAGVRSISYNGVVSTMMLSWGWCTNQHAAYMNEKYDVRSDTYMTYTVIYG